MHDMAQTLAGQPRKSFNIIQGEAVKVLSYVVNWLPHSYCTGNQVCPAG